MVIEKFEQESLLTAIKRGRRDFTEVTVTSPVDLLLGSNVQSLVFDRANLGPCFRIGCWKNPEADLSMVGTIGLEVIFNSIWIRSLGLSLRGDYCWLQMKNCGGNSISLVGSIFNNGLRISDSWADVLDLSGVQSKRTSIEDKSWFRSIIENGADLGSCTPVTLGDLVLCA